MLKKNIILFISLLFIMSFIACTHMISGDAISQPDEYSHVYEAKGTVVLRAIANVFKEKHIGTNVTIDEKNMIVDSDYVESGDWRTKTRARVKQVNWKECEVFLAVITEKKTEKGWEMRRLLQKEQYDNFFSVIDLRIYEEMSKIE
jgi:hypothetical protein